MIQQVHAVKVHGVGAFHQHTQILKHPGPQRRLPTIAYLPRHFPAAEVTEQALVKKNERGRWLDEGTAPIFEPSGQREPGAGAADPGSDIGLD